MAPISSRDVPREGTALHLHHHMLLHQPWASWVAEGRLPFLVRTQAAPVRGWEGVFATLRFDALAGASPLLKDLPKLAVVGAVWISESIPVPENTPVLTVLTRRFGRRLASFHPANYLPTQAGRWVYVWVLGASVRAKTPKRITMRKYPWVWMKRDVEITVGDACDMSYAKAVRR